MDIVKNSKILTNNQKHMVRIYFDSASQAAFNAATGMHSGIGCNGEDNLDTWEIFYNNMMQALHIANHMEHLNTSVG